MSKITISLHQLGEAMKSRHCHRTITLGHIVDCSRDYANAKALRQHEFDTQFYVTESTTAYVNESFAALAMALELHQIMDRSRSFNYIKALS